MFAQSQCTACTLLHWDTYLNRWQTFRKDTMAAATFEELEAIIDGEGEMLVVDVRSHAEFSQVYRCNMAITGSKN